jgi:hypothetical protein
LQQIRYSNFDPEEERVEAFKDGLRPYGGASDDSET